MKLFNVHKNEQKRIDWHWFWHVEVPVYWHWFWHIEVPVWWGNLWLVKFAQHCTHWILALVQRN